MDSMQVIIFISACAMFSVSGQHCTRLENMDIDYGNDLAGIRAQESECCRICEEYDGCKAYAFNIIGGGTCWLKPNPGPPYPFWGTIVGILGEVEPSEATSPPSNSTSATTPSITTTQPIPTSTLKPCGHAQCPPSIDGNYPDPQDCRGFVQCVAGAAYCLNCQSGLHYHVENNECDYPHNVDCGSRPIP